jgi:hypothetical protein
MKIGIAILLVLLLCYSQLSFASDVFDNVKCGADIPSALIGKRERNEPVVKTEARHKDIGLHDIGAYGISENLDTISWMICGNEYMLLVDKKSLINDVIQVPDHSKHALAFTGTCEINGTEKPDIIFAILNDEEGKKMLAASAAWLIDEKTKKFKKLSVDGMICPREYAY